MTDTSVTTDTDNECQLIGEPIVKNGYQIKKEHRLTPDGHWIEMTSAYNFDGQYLGDPDLAEWLCSDGFILRWRERWVLSNKFVMLMIRCPEITRGLGIDPEKADPEHNVCTIGWSALNKKWYGWSHRAIRGYAVGQKITPGMDDALIKTGIFKADYVLADKEEARTAATIFARSVS